MRFPVYRSDAAILAAIPAQIIIPSLLKASPVEEDGERLLYIEASNEEPDRQGEIILQKALKESSDFYLRHGNIDIAHYTLLGPKAGIPNYLTYEIGKPVAVSVTGKRTFVKSHLYKGDSAMARNANMVWESITKQTPAARWYPSVGGTVLSKSVKIDPKSRERIGVVDRVRWSNIGLTRTPVNTDVPEVSTAAVGTFAKALDGYVVSPAAAGYGADRPAVVGKGAATRNSLSRAPYSGAMTYADLRERLASDIIAGVVGNADKQSIEQHLVMRYGLSDADAGATAIRFMRDLR